MTAQNNKSIIVSIEHLCKHFKGNLNATLQDINFTIHQGESVALVGANGAGKSTLIKSILGLIKATSGEVTVMNSLAGDTQSNIRIGYLPEVPGFWGELSATELLESMGKIHSIEKSQIQKRSKKLLSLMGLTQRGQRHMSGYSKGMLQRTGIAAALLHDPDFIILDEPMSGLDPRAQEKMRAIVQKLREAGKTFLISSHSLEDIRGFCDRVIVIERSKLVLDGPTSEVLQTLVEKYRSSEPWDEDPLGEIPDESWSLE